MGTGAGVTAGSRVSLQWVFAGRMAICRFSIARILRARCTLSLGGDASSQFDPFVFTVGDGKALVGIDEGVMGMKQGGVRRLVLPVRVAYTTCRRVGWPAAGRVRPATDRARVTKQDPKPLLEVEAIGQELTVDCDEDVSSTCMNNDDGVRARARGCMRGFVWLNVKVVDQM